MFPTLDYLINYLFGTNLQLYFPPTFGFWVAMAFLGAAWVLSRELKRKEKGGLVHAVKKMQWKGKPASAADLVINGILGFVLGWKVVGAITESDIFTVDPQAYLLSTQGNIIAGILLGAVFAYLKYREKQKGRLAVPVKEEVAVHPYQLTGTITIVAAIWGIIGAKIFHQLEYWDDFVRDPAAALVSSSGLTFYGGLIGGTLGVYWYARKNKIPAVHIADAVAPGLILAYGIGRIGCMLSGDGDWGVINSAYRISEDRQYTVVAADAIQNDIGVFYEIYAASPSEVDHIYFAKPSWLGFLPDWAFAFDYPHNVNEEGIRISGCEGRYCNRLPLPVFPTAMYEVIMALSIFGGLWALRKKLKYPGQMFFLYLLLNGVERFLIEQIRVNSTYSLFGMQITQAEIIATVLMLVGLFGLLFIHKIKDKIIKI